MGEAEQPPQKAIPAAAQTMMVDTLGGRIQVSWDKDAAATPMGQIVFFAAYLEATGLFDTWVEDCPLVYTSPNAPQKRDVLGTLLLSILAGHRRYAHVTGLRSDGVSPRILGMHKIVSEDALRRALGKIPEAEGTAWMREHLFKSVVPACTTPWILDIDTTVKPLFGHQEGAEVGYNPHKPGRPSHAYHAYWMGNLRLLLDVEVTAGNTTASNHAQPGLNRVLDTLTAEQRPHLVRGDCGFGNDAVIREMESRQQAYLFKLRQSPRVKRLLQRVFTRRDWTDAGQGWEGREDHIQLAGWQQNRRVVILRRLLKENLIATREVKGQMAFAFLDRRQTKVYEYAVLVTDLAESVLGIAQLYRDRADAENGFDELKNQWGWGGYTTRDLARCRLSARAVGLIYNWWSWYTRLAFPEMRKEAITSRPLLLSAIGRSTKHAGQTQLYLTPMHAAQQKVERGIENIRQGLQTIRQTAERLLRASPWDLLASYIVAQITQSPWSPEGAIPALPGP
ncbi:transposase [Acidithiobacillus sp. M4-SHS-6]|uniref:transposase n=1 Tax=Acidithiobacillus sp. M4-SHS-6 TaxID=3383024 RepID=UPI0039BDDD2F